MNNEYRVWVRFMQDMQNVLSLNEDGSVMTDGYDYCIEKEAIDLMRCSGWYDNDLNLIYEGDIVKDHFGTGVVKYSEEFKEFKVSYGNSKAKWFRDYVLKNERESIQVVGDIYRTYKLIVKSRLSDD